MLEIINKNLKLTFDNQKDHQVHVYTEQGTRQLKAGCELHPNGTSIIVNKELDN